MPVVDRGTQFRMWALEAEMRDCSNTMLCQRYGVTQVLMLTRGVQRFHCIRQTAAEDGSDNSITTRVRSYAAQCRFWLPVMRIKKGKVW
jgi:hypothetical protein